MSEAAFSADPHFLCSDFFALCGLQVQNCGAKPGLISGLRLPPILSGCHNQVDVN